MQGHGEGCPDCTGSVQLVPLAGRAQENIAAVDRVGTPFEMQETTDLDGALRLALLGGLDIVVADRLTARLRVLRSWGRHVRIDLSGLEFIDCTGLEAIIEELTAARRAGQAVEVDRPVSAPVKRVVTFMDAAETLWASEDDVARPALRVIEGDAPAAPPEPARETLKASPQALGVVGDPRERRPRTPGASLTSDG